LIDCSDFSGFSELTPSSYTAQQRWGQRQTYNGVDNSRGVFVSVGEDDVEGIDDPGCPCDGEGDDNQQ